MECLQISKPSFYAVACAQDCGLYLENLSLSNLSTLINGESLLGLTIHRGESLSAPICVTNEEHRFFVQEMLKGVILSSPSSILLEPAGPNTAADMVSIALMPGIVDSDLLVFLPSDHFVPGILALIRRFHEAKEQNLVRW